MKRDREDELDLADIGGQAGAATHDASIAGPECGGQSGWTPRRDRVIVP